MNFQEPDSGTLSYKVGIYVIKIHLYTSTQNIVSHQPGSAIKLTFYTFFKDLWTLH